MILDECTPFLATEKQARDRWRCLRWVKRSKGFPAFDKGKVMRCLGLSRAGFMKIFDWKAQSNLLDIGFDGYAVGGLAVGEDKKKC